ncbi:uncharacterized protein FOKN1_0788 [Thiohalobacter thiocyanaticus]|uniref:HYR domain-containing protein n=1 Tax=Thiohalobacter thiocyanaticus TaxID=585455 RepID=A0A1Z4VNJ0_9GAMM|nr:hypothetical protein [Thiohalobacter thiocyanaticus]BAZ93190.1 uncharacterized protein FOKN1_0788 [Thiohalobacter thiocyanaticus]
MNTLTQSAKRSITATAIAAALGTAMAPQTVSATTYTFNWTGYFTMLDSDGAALENTSLPSKGVNRFQTPVSGTLTIDDTDNTGSMTIDSFDFFNGSLPAVASGVTFTDTDGQAGPGTLLLGNMLFDWNGNDGIPVSIVWDASGLLTYLGGTPTVGDVLTGSGATPDSDGTYTGATYGYLSLGATPVATTAWNTSLAAGCAIGADGDFTSNTGGGCMGINPSGALPLVTDTAANNNDFSANTGATPGTHDDNGDTFFTYYGIGGNPMADGPFQNFNANFDLTSLELVSDGSGPTFTVPADPDTTVAETATPTTVTVDIGTVTDESGGTVEFYNPNTGSWEADSGGVNNVDFDLTETVNSFTVDWRAWLTDPAVDGTLGSQTVTITITDTTAPTFSSVPSDITVSVSSTAETVTFEGPGSTAGSIVADDATDPDPVVEWSLDNLNWTADTAAADESSSDFAAGANTVYWRVTDATGNSFTYEQTVTLDLPTGIIGQPCEVDATFLTADLVRQLEGTFIMRDSTNSLVGTVDEEVTGHINGSVTCADTSCTDSGAELESGKPFFGSLWSTSGIRLFDQPGTYTFETCLNDGSTSCTAPQPLSMTVGPNQLGAHMLFDWSVNKSIDVVVVWDFGCAGAELVSTDPDGDGIIGTKMVDGPFKGMNAAFDLSTIDGEQPITTGGFTTTIPAVNNPVDNTSPLPVNPGTVGTALGGITITESELMDTFGASTDDSVERSCIGGCFDFEVTGRATGETIYVVLPLSEPIPWYSLYRKYDPDTDSWSTFVEDGTDSVTTAALNADGSCPEPGSGDYSSESSSIMANMLRADDQCVQLTITDGGPNDDDDRDGVIADPGGVGVTSGPSSPEAKTTDGGLGGGGCSLATTSQRPLDWALVGLLLGSLGLVRRRRRS